MSAAVRSRALALRSRALALRAVFTRDRLLSANAVLAYVTLAGFVGHMLVAGNYGYFRDELYYIISGRHPALGYVDFPPLTALLAALVRVLAGDNLVALHVIPALANAALVLVTGLMARELGGGRAARALAAVGSLTTLVFMANGSIFSMDALDALWWALAAYVVMLVVRRHEPRLWLLFGLVAGVGLFTKLTILFFGLALVVGVLLTPLRRDFRTPWPWLGGAIAGIFLAPYLLWNATNGWPTLQFFADGSHGNGALDFLINQLVITNPLTLPLWIGGLVFYFRRPAGKPYRALGWTWVFAYILLTLVNGKPYYFTPAYPMLFAGGAVVLAEAARKASREWLRPAYAGALVMSGLLLAPLAMPVLPPATYARDYTFLSFIGNSGAGKGGQTSVLPQYLADRFGWMELTRAVARVYDVLPPDERAQACIFTANYGEASALNFFGPAEHLPPAISGHNNYYLWGPGRCSGGVIIAVNVAASDLEKTYAHVTPAATFSCAYCWPDEDGISILVATDPRVPLNGAWGTVKNFG